MKIRTKSLYSILIALVVSLGGFLLGFDGAVISGAIPFYKMSLALSDNPYLLGLSVSSIVGGSIAGNFIAGYVCDRIGRKPTLIITSILFLTGSVGTAAASDISVFIIYRIIGGVGVGMAILAAPIYIAEIAPPKQRGKLVTFNQLNIVLGLSVAYFSNYFILKAIEDPELNWRWMLGIGGVPALVYFLLLLLVPESPRWLIRKGKEEKGKLILQKAGGKEHAEFEFQNIKKSLSQSADKKKAGWKELFSSKMRFVLLIGLALAFFQQISGINAVLYYAPLIFETAGGGRDTAFMQSIILGLVFIGGTVLSMFLIDRLGRKPLLIIGSSVMLLSLLTVGLSFQMASYKLEKNDVTQIAEFLVKEAVLAQATLENPTHYSKDSITLSVNKAFLYKDGKVLSEIDMENPEMKSALQEVTILKSILSSHSGKIGRSEQHYFNSIKKDLQGVIAALLRSEQTLKEGDPFYASTIAVKDIKPEDSVLAAAIAGQRFTIYKSIILRHSINIHADWVLLGILGFIFGFSISLGPVMWTMLSEIFPNSLRGLAISVAGTFNALTSFLVASIFPVELDYFGSAITYFIFAGFIAFCLLFVVKYIPETKGKSLEEIEKALVGEVITKETENEKSEIIYAGH